MNWPVDATDLTNLDSAGPNPFKFPTIGGPFQGLQSTDTRRDFALFPTPLWNDIMTPLSWRFLCTDAATLTPGQLQYIKSPQKQREEYGPVNHNAIIEGYNQLLPSTVDKPSPMTSLPEILPSPSTTTKNEFDPQRCSPLLRNIPSSLGDEDCRASRASSTVSMMHFSDLSVEQIKKLKRKQGNTESQARTRQHNTLVKKKYKENDILISSLQKQYFREGMRNPLLHRLFENYQSCPEKERPKRQKLK
uniref:BZIP domain-containing protein n=2 Tax=Panagrolaimus sp. JU765 TaxID=591449 RepID=A0AC34QRD7_9BILA